MRKTIVFLGVLLLLAACGLKRDLTMPGSGKYKSSSDSQQTSQTPVAAQGLQTGQAEQPSNVKPDSKTPEPSLTNPAVVAPPPLMSVPVTQ